MQDPISDPICTCGHHASWHWATGGCFVSNCRCKEKTK